MFLTTREFESFAFRLLESFAFRLLFMNLLLSGSIFRFPAPVYFFVLQAFEALWLSTKLLTWGA
jgi:hypothetical protein